MTNHAEELDVQVSESESEGTWIAQEANGTIHTFATEDDACAFQRAWRIRIGLNPISGEREQS